MVFCLLSCTSIHSDKGFTFKGKNLLPRSKFFPFSVYLFSEGRQNNFDRVVSPESVSIPLNKLNKNYYIQTIFWHDRFIMSICVFFVLD